MDHAQLLQHFELLTETPEAIAKLREFILELAITGRLLDQNGKADWHTFFLDDLGEWGSGGTPSKSVSEYYGGNIPWLIIGDLNDGTVTSAKTYITDAGLANSSAQLLEKNVLLIAMYGSIGKLGITGFRCATNQAIAFCKPDETKVTLRFLFYLLRASKKKLLNRGQGLAQQNISQRILKAFTVRIPQVSEQRRIVAKVEELLALCDELEARQTAARENRTRLVRSSLDHLTTAQDESDFKKHSAFCLQHSELLFDSVPALRQAILSLAVKGHLTEQKAADGDAADLLRTIAKHKEQLVKAKQLKAREIIAPAEESPPILPVNWAWCRLAEICLNITDGFHNTPKTTSSGVRYITAQHIRPNVIDFDNCFFVSEIDHQELVSKTKPRKGDILVVNIGAGSGTAAIVNADFEFSFKNVAILNKYDAIDSTYLYYVLHESRPAIFEELTKGGAQPFLSLGVLRNIVVTLPPLAEQQRIVTKLDELLRRCDALEARLTAARTAATHLLDATLHQILAN